MVCVPTSSTWLVWSMTSDKGDRTTRGRTMNKRAWAMGVLITGLMCTMSTEAAMVLPFNVEEITGRAEKIFVGTCTQVEHTVNEQGFPIVTVTFSVTEVLKGTVGDTITFRQLDPTHQQQIDPHLISPWSAAALAGVPTYTLGEEAMLFLAGES